MLYGNTCTEHYLNLSRLLFNPENCRRNCGKKQLVISDLFSKSINVKIAL